MGFDHKQFRTDERTVVDESLIDLQRRRSTAITVVVVVSLAILGVVIYNFLSLRENQDPIDQAMIEQGRIIEKAVTAYYQSNAEFPDSLDQVVQYFPTDGLWPLEPYNGTSICDTGSPEFNVADSVGMVHYERLSNEKAGYRIHVFGREGTLIILAGGYVEER